MKIEIKSKPPQARLFGDIVVGECFIHASVSFIRIPYLHNTNALSIGTGEALSLSNITPIKPIKKITLEEE